MKDYLQYGVEDFITDESYLRYYFRENETDIQFWTEWITLHPEKLDVIISANNYIDAFAVRLPEAEFQREQQRFARDLDEMTFIENRRPAQNRRKRITRALLAMSVVAAVSTIVYVALQQNRGGTSNGEKIAMIEKYVPKGERAKITLPDGSEVELNADSKLTYPSKFTGHTRELQLTGEAFFRVQHDAQHPFHVTAANMGVTVLGTTFNMQCYPNKKQATVALVTGKVRLKAQTDTMVLAPAEMGVFNKATAALEKTHYDMVEETGWRVGTVVFKNADFTELADRFDKVYNIRLINLSNKTEFRFNGSFTSNSPEEIVKSICLSKQLSYSTNGNTITIH